MSDYVQPESTGTSHDYDDITVDGTSGGVVLLQENKHRVSALIINTGNASMRVTTDGTAPTPTRGKRIISGASLSLSGMNCPIGKVIAIRESGASTTANASEVD